MSIRRLQKPRGGLCAGLETSQIPDYSHSGNESSPSNFKLCSLRRSRQHCTCMSLDANDQEVSIPQNYKDRELSILGFLVWVAYSRSRASQITEIERRRCPMLFCRKVLPDEDQLRDHVFGCVRLSDGMYWCFHCQKYHNLYQCKHSQQPAFRKERISTRAKRIFRWLGAKSHEKDSRPSEAWSPQTLSPGIQQQHCSEHPPNYSECSEQELSQSFETTVPSLPELDDKAMRVELSSYSQNSPAELDSHCSSGSSYIAVTEPNASSPELGVIWTGKDHDSTGYTSEPTSTDPFHRNTIHSPHQPVDQLGFSSCFTTDPQEESNWLSQPLISPLSSSWTTSGCNESMPTSPSETPCDDTSLFTHNSTTSVSPASARSNSVQGLPHPPPMQEEGERTPITPVSPASNEAAELPQCSAPFAVPTQAANNRLSANGSHFRSTDWSNLESLTRDFKSVLGFHTSNSHERLRLLPRHDVVRELLSMTPESITAAGLSTLEKITNGYYPSKIPELYAILHVAYACVIIIYEQEMNHLELMFSHSLALGDIALSGADRQIFADIVRSIWLPPLHGDCPRSSIPTTTNCNIANQSQHPIIDPFVKDRFTPLTSTQPLLSEGCVGMPFHDRRSLAGAQQPFTQNNIVLKVLYHFLDLVEGSISKSCPPKSTKSYPPANSSIDRMRNDFARTVRENITEPLMKASLTPEPSLEAFIDGVAAIERRVDRGVISTIREVQVELILAGRSVTRSEELYEIFEERANRLCESVCTELQRYTYLRKIYHSNLKTLWELLCDAEAKNKVLLSGEDKWTSECCREPLSPNLHRDIPLTSKVTATRSKPSLVGTNRLHRRTAIRRPIKRKRAYRPQTPETEDSPESTPPNLFPPTISSPSSEGSQSSCYCGFRPTGDPKWHTSNLRRHMKTHGERTKLVCNHEGCDKTFTRSDNLGQHIKEKHEYNKRRCNRSNETP